MADYKELAIYAIIVIVIAIGVAYVLSNTLLGGNYKVDVTITQYGNATYPYQTSQFLINVTNVGSSAISNLPVGFYLNGIQQTVNNTSIPAGQTVTLIRNYTYTSPGSFYFQAIADPGQTFNIQDRQQAKSSMTINISRPSPPDIYTSMPNGNITATQTFAMGSSGAIGSAAIYQQYNVSLVDALFGPKGNVTDKIFEDAYKGIAVVNGGYAQYSNGSIAYTAWFQGTTSPQFINEVLRSFGFNVTASQNGQVYSANVGNDVSMCDLYNGGWTKLITYYNNSLPETCLDLATTTFNNTESTKLQSIIGQNKNLTQLEAYFYYTNSSNLGSYVGYSNSNLSLSEIFQNNASGLFISTMKRLNQSINITEENSTCNGVVHNNGTLHMCSYVIPPRVGLYELPFDLMNSSYISSNYIINLYSLVNNTLLYAAEYNAGQLIKAVATKAKILNESSVPWESPFKNACAFSNETANSIGCSVKNFTNKNFTGYLNLTNHFNSQIRINSFLCEVAPGFQPVKMNNTINPNSTITIATMCNIIAAPFVAAQTSFILKLNYTYQNVTKTVNGTMFINNQLQTG